MNTGSKLLLIFLLAGGVLLISSPMTSAQTISQSFLAQLAEILNSIRIQLIALEAEISGIEQQITVEELAEPFTEPPPPALPQEPTPPPVLIVPPPLASPPPPIIATSTSTTTVPILPPPPVATSTPTTTVPILPTPPPSPSAILSPLPPITISEELHFTKQLELGDEGEDIADVQRFLAEQGYFDIDQYPLGFYDLVTQEGVGRWQEEQGIVRGGAVVTTGKGRWGPQTIARANKIEGETVTKIAAQLRDDGFPVNSLAPVPDLRTPLNKFHVVWKTADLGAPNSYTSINYAVWDGESPPQIMGGGSGRPERNRVQATMDSALDRTGNHHLAWINPVGKINYQLNSSPFVSIPLPKGADSIEKVAIDLDNNLIPHIAGIAKLPNGKNQIFVGRRNLDDWSFKILSIESAVEDVGFDFVLNPVTGVYNLFYSGTDQLKKFYRLAVKPDFSFSKPVNIPKPRGPLPWYAVEYFKAALWNEAYVAAAFPFRRVWAGRWFYEFGTYLLTSKDNWQTPLFFDKEEMRPGLVAIGDRIIFMFGSKYGANFSSIWLFSSFDNGRNWRNQILFSNSVSRNPVLTLGPSGGVAAVYESEVTGQLEAAYTDHIIGKPWRWGIITKVEFPEELRDYRIYKEW